MAQNKRAARGRPRKYVPDVDLACAADLFLSRGFSAASLDELGEAMGMNRPSIQAAFGDKSELFAKALHRYGAEMRAAFHDALGSDQPLVGALRTLFTTLLDRFADTKAPRGCLLFTVAASEAERTPEVRVIIDAAVRELDTTFEARFERARVKGEIPVTTNVRERALLASGLIHTLAIRSRAGETRRELTRVVDAYLAVLTR